MMISRIVRLALAGILAAALGSSSCAGTSPSFRSVVSGVGVTESWGPLSGQHGRPPQIARGSTAMVGLASGLAVERSNAVQVATRRNARR